MVYVTFLIPWVVAEKTAESKKLSNDLNFSLFLLEKLYFLLPTISFNCSDAIIRIYKIAELRKKFEKNANTLHIFFHLKV